MGFQQESNRGTDSSQPEKPEPEPGEQSPPYVCGIGASAGGLEALERLFRHLPADTGMAFIIVQHLSPDFDSVMDELLVRQTEMPVCIVEDGMVVQPDHIYLIPPKKDMIISGGRLLLTDKDPLQAFSRPIDTFFRSVAQDCGSRGIGVILSGTGSDGARGVRAIHESGGLVLVQSEETARFDGMPRSALDTGVVDLVLSPEEIAAALARYAKSPGIRQLASSMDAVPVDGDAMNRLMRRLRDTYGIDFSLYKPTTVRRRIERRLQLNQSVDFDEYVAQVEQDPQELGSLYHDLLIGVTQFFRDREAFDLIEKQVLPDLLVRVAPEAELRMWVAGCATGEEAYSIAILVHERLTAAGRPINAKIFASDVDKASLEVASTGVYPESALTEVSAERRQRYFTRKGNSYQVNAELRQMVVFAQHNVIKDAPFTRLDMIACRNLLIYLQPMVQKKVISLFHFGLKAGGILFLGPSEGVADLADEFQVVDQHWKIYRKLRDVRLPAMTARLPYAPGASLRQRARSAVRATETGLDGQLDAAYREIMERFTPPAVLIDDRFEIIHVFGNATDYLHFKPGPTSSNILDLFDADLRTAVSGAIQRATKENASVTYTGVSCQRDGEPRKLKLSVIPLVARQQGPHYMLIALEELHLPSAPAVDETKLLDVDEAARDRIVQLEAELQHTKESLQSTIEELETSNEELHATNEELVASNEELQSTNEELHSVNEELYTVNAEYQRKITELSELTEDMDNLLASTDVGVLFLDKDLCIRKFTPQIGQLFNIVEQDVGRPFDHFTHTVQHENLMQDVRWVLTSGLPFEKEVQDRTGRWYFLRILPYQSKSDTEGVVLTLIDIQTIKHAESELHEKQQQLEGVLDHSPAFIYVKNLEGRYLIANRQSHRVLGQSPEKVLGRTDSDFLPRPVADRLVAHDRSIAATGKPAAVEEVIPYRGKGRTYLANLYPLHGPDGRVVATAGILTDITRQKLAQRRARRAVRQREEFLAMLSHELRNPLAAIAGAADLMVQMESQDADMQQMCSIIRRQTQLVVRLLDDLLDVSRIAQGKIELRKETLDLRVPCQDAVDAARATIEQHRHELRVEMPEDSVWVDGDPVRLQQVVVNLLVNAAKYTPDGGQISLRLATADGKASVVVRDTGVGMTDEFRKKVFDPFVQSTRSVDRRDGGIGLGLTLVQALTRMHGGEVEVHSEGPGRGSEFTVWLPLAEKRPELERTHSTTRPATTPPRSLKVLVIEDNDDLRRTLQMMLEKQGVQVTVAADGVSGLTALDRTKPDVALVDIGLPELNGYEVARRAREHGHETYLIALTGYGQEDDRRRAAEAGFDAHITKPVTFDQLQSTLSAVAADRGAEC